MQTELGLRGSEKVGMETAPPTTLELVTDSSSSAKDEAAAAAAAAVGPVPLGDDDAAATRHAAEMRERRFRNAVICRREGKGVRARREREGKDTGGQKQGRGQGARCSKQLLRFDEGLTRDLPQGVKPRQGCASERLNRECKEGTKTPVRLLV